MTLRYTTIQPPFTLKFREMSRQELKEYFRWFLDVSPVRIRELTKALRETSGFEGWQADETPLSLDRLGEWFATQVEARVRTDDERMEIAGRSNYPIEVPSEELTSRTFSLAMDVGMYLGRVLVRNHPSLQWDLPLGDKKFVDYGQPVLVGFGAVPMNPVRLVVTLAYGLLSNKQSGKRLREIYDYWSRQVRASA